MNFIQGALLLILDGRIFAVVEDVRRLRTLAIMPKECCCLPLLCCVTDGLFHELIVALLNLAIIFLFFVFGRGR